MAFLPLHFVFNALIVGSRKGIQPVRSLNVGDGLALGVQMLCTHFIVPLPSSLAAVKPEWFDILASAYPHGCSGILGR